MTKMSALYNGVSILIKYEADSYSVCAEHDQLYCGKTAPEKMSKDELETMEGNGWIWDSDLESWFIFT